MSEILCRIIEISEWVEKARKDPVEYIKRQATEVVLAAISAMPSTGGHFFLKGGLLMSLGYDSPRKTTDVDFTCDLPATQESVTPLRAGLDAALPVAAARLGYASLRFRVQKFQQRPREFGTPNTTMPALELNIGYADTGSHEEIARLAGDGVTNPVKLEISFNEPVQNTEKLHLDQNGAIIFAYAVTDLIAEKFRALLQQVTRRHPHYRRQDVYDIALLVDRVPLNLLQREQILSSFLIKCAARQITPNIGSLSHPDIVAHARSEWATLRQEIGLLPDFDACFAKVNGLYRSLPWQPFQPESP